MRIKLPQFAVPISFILSSFLCCLSVLGQQSAAQQSDGRASELPATTSDSQAVGATSNESTSKPIPGPKLAEPNGAKRLSPEYDVWLDAKQKAVLIDGQVSLREGMLEMFACTKNTKEHESVVSANTKAYIVHAALLSLGAEPGSTAQWVPKYRPPTGTEIEITVYWLDEKGQEHTARAQDWVKDMRTGKAMSHPWVFAGSRFWTDEETGKKYYQAEGGDFICVSNFSTAMLDIPIESSHSNEELAFQAFTERIPPLGAPVRLILKPVLKEKKENKPPAASAAVGGGASTTEGK